MASPFSIFRRQEKTLIAVLAIMAMFAFTFVGFAGMSVQALMQFIRGGSGGPGGEVVARTNGGAIREADLAELVQRRFVANAFLANAQMQSGNQFGATRNFFGPPTEEDVVNAMLIRRHAQELGMRIGDKAVGEFIDGVTRDPQTGQERFTTEMFEKLCEQFRVSGETMFDILRDELMVSQMVQAVGGSSIVGGGVAMMTPAELWESYQKLNTQVTLEVAAVPVADLTGQVPDPPQEELREYFEEHKDQLPDPSTPEPGFLQPQRVQVEYLMANFDRFLEGTEVSEEEISQYYDANKEQRYRIFDDLPNGDESDVSDPSDVEKTDPESGEAPATPADSQSAPEAGEKPAQPDSKPEDKSKPATDPQPGDEGAKTTPDAPDENDQEDASETPTKPADEPDDRGNQESLEEQTETPSAQAPETADPKEIPSEQSGSDEKREASGEPAADPEQPAEAPEAAETPPENPPADTASDANQEESADEAIPPSAQQQAGQSEDGAEPRYRPLDDALALEIRDELRREKTLQRIEQVLDNISYSTLQKYERDLSDWEDPEVEVKQPERPDLKSLAERYGLEYGLTPLVSFQEAGELEGIGTARDFRGPSDQEPSFAIDVFSGSPLFEPKLVRDEQSNGYLYWKVEEIPQHVPRFEDVCEQVLASWKLERARDLAADRAEELAQEARDSGQSLEEAFAGNPAVIVEKTSAFSWISNPAALNPNPFSAPPPQRSQIDEVDQPGDEFFETIFGLSEGDITTVPNAPKTVWYVARVTSREDAKREQFLSESFFGQSIFGIPLPTAYDYLAGEMRQEVMQKWVAQLQQSAGLEWVREPDQPIESDDAVAAR